MGDKAPPVQGGSLNGSEYEQCVTPSALSGGLESSPLSCAGFTLFRFVVASRRRKLHIAAQLGRVPRRPCDNMSDARATIQRVNASLPGNVSGWTQA